MTFSQKVSAAVRAKKSPVVVGIDPRFALIPESLRAGVVEGDWQGMARVYQDFSCKILDIVAPYAPCVKPQLAFFEMLGPHGMFALANVIEHARSLNLVVILDGKRNDIGSTAEGYAAAYLGERSPWRGDALTINPYLGDDSLAPFVKTAEDCGAGIFVLVKTSNPGGGMLQDLEANGKTIYQHSADWVESAAAKFANLRGDQYGAVGAVVGATYPEQLAHLRTRMPHAWILVPGFGAQGGGVKDVLPAFDDQGLGALINNSRGIIFSYIRPEMKERYSENEWEAAVEDAARTMRELFIDVVK
ncbi:MAG: orotidine-5'-phosphate decarboxylase [Planctomycetia bacterium]|nr:orotidine-5'-phosphate decarboxylase [Planctomycetia bacterium]